MAGSIAGAGASVGSGRDYQYGAKTGLEEDDGSVQKALGFSSIRRRRL